MSPTIRAAMRLALHVPRHGPPLTFWANLSDGAVLADLPCRCPWCATSSRRKALSAQSSKSSCLKTSST
eukprot:5263458-Pleurochrysis_carterae.AAC.1